jgi:Lon-like LonC helical domain
MTELRKIDVAAGIDTAGPAFAVGQSLAAPLLYRRCDPAELPFAVCTELEEAPGLIGQERAVEAVQFAMRMRRKGYNVYALGPSGSGRHSAVKGLLLAKAETEQTPSDWCYVNNFADPQRPHCLQLPPGRGSGLSVAMKHLVEELRAALPAAFERDEFRTHREVLDQQFNSAASKLSARCSSAQKRKTSHCCARQRVLLWHQGGAARC